MRKFPRTQVLNVEPRNVPLQVSGGVCELIADKLEVACWRFHHLASSSHMSRTLLDRLVHGNRTVVNKYGGSEGVDVEVMVVRDAEVPHFGCAGNILGTDDSTIISCLMPEMANDLKIVVSLDE
jgi:hypothetical protein